VRRVTSLHWLQSAVMQRWWRWSVPGALRRAGVHLGGAVVAYGQPIVTVFPGAMVSLGDRVVLCSHPTYSALGVAGPVILRAMRPGAKLSVGDDSGLSGTVICAAVSVVIGRQCLFGANVKVFDTDFHALNPEGRRHESDWARIKCAPVTIGDNVFLGTGAMVCKGVSIGDGCVIGAGSVVTADIPAYSVAAGNPARVIGTVFGART
jgi:acetyltransferase-like isoleucine patch superfamily enzyme